MQNAYANFGYFEIYLLEQNINIRNLTEREKYFIHALNPTINSEQGGKRQGAGRPSGVNQKPILLKVDLDLVDFLSTKPNRNKFINDCIREKN